MKTCPSFVSLLLAGLLLAACSSTPRDASVPCCGTLPSLSPENHTYANIYRAIDTGNGLGEYLGRVDFTDVEQGLRIDVKIKGLPPGEHGFHIHENPDCSPLLVDGKPAPAMAAGGHLDPEKTGRHLGPEGGGHKGDLPFLTADENGDVNQTFIVRGLKATLFKHRSVMIHAGGDNYSDTPLPLGGGGARIACGITH